MTSSESATSEPTSPVPESGESERRSAGSAYWRANIRSVAVLMCVWAFLSFGCGIFWSEWLDQWNLPGTSMPLGFFMAQQGAIYGFLILILVYIWRMNALDRKFRERSASTDEDTPTDGDGPVGGH